MKNEQNANNIEKAYGINEALTILGMKIQDIADIIDKYNSHEDINEDEVEELKEKILKEIRNKIKGQYNEYHKLSLLYHTDASQYVKTSQNAKKEADEKFQIIQTAYNNIMEYEFNELLKQDPTKGVDKFKKGVSLSGFNINPETWGNLTIDEALQSLKERYPNYEKEMQLRFKETIPQTEMDTFRDLFEDLILEGIIGKNYDEGNLKVEMTDPKFPSKATAEYQNERNDKSIYFEVGTRRLNSPGMMALFSHSIRELGMPDENPKTDALMSVQFDRRIGTNTGNGFRIKTSDAKKAVKNYQSLDDENKKAFKKHISLLKAQLKGKEPLLNFILSSKINDARYPNQINVDSANGLGVGCDSIEFKDKNLIIKGFAFNKKKLDALNDVVKPHKIELENPSSETGSDLIIPITAFEAYNKSEIGKRNMKISKYKFLIKNLDTPKETINKIYTDPDFMKYCIEAQLESTRIFRIQDSNLYFTNFPIKQLRAIMSKEDFESFKSNVKALVDATKLEALESINQKEELKKIKGFGEEVSKIPPIETRLAYNEKKTITNSQSTASPNVSVGNLNPSSSGSRVTNAQPIDSKNLENYKKNGELWVAGFKPFIDSCNAKTSFDFFQQISESKGNDWVDKMPKNTNLTLIRDSIKSYPELQNTLDGIKEDLQAHIQNRIEQEVHKSFSQTFKR